MVETLLRAATTQDAATQDQVALYGGWIKRTALFLKIRMPWADLDELMQWGAVGMLEAQKRFDPMHGVTFPSFAARRIRGAMIDGLRRDGTRRRHEAPLDTDAVDASASPGRPEDPLACLQRADDAQQLAAALRLLPVLEYRVLALHFFDEMNNREIAAILEISEGYASRLRKRALAALAARMAASTTGDRP